MRRFRKSLGYACAGIAYALRTQRHMRFHAAAAVGVIVLSLLAGLTPAEWALILLTIAAVIAAELVNTAVEQTVDLAHPGMHPLAKAAKDVAAGAVLVVALAAVMIGILILGPPLWQLIVA